MFRYLFDLSYEKSTDEALVFYFVYIIFGYYITFILNYFVDTYPFIYKFGALMFVIPFAFYMCVSICIALKKKLNSYNDINLILYVVIITLLVPLCLGVCFWGGFLGYDGSFRLAIKGAFMIYFFPNLVLGGIPVAILTTKENNSLKNEIRQMEQERLEHEQWIEKQLLIERSIRIRQNDKKTTGNKKNI